MSLAEVSAGRFVLGLGTAPPTWNEDWHGLTLTKPVTRMREYIECIRTMWTGSPAQSVSYTGEFYRVRDYRRFMPAPPIYLATVAQPNLSKGLGRPAASARFARCVIKPCAVDQDAKYPRRLARTAIALYARLAVLRCGLRSARLRGTYSSDPRRGAARGCSRHAGRCDGRDD